MGEKGRTFGTNVEDSAKRNRSGISDPYAESKIFGLHPERSRGDRHAVRAQADLLRRITTTEVTDEEQNTNSFTSHPQRVTTWKHTLKDVSKGTVRLEGEAHRH